MEGVVVYRIGGEIRLCCRLIERERGREKGRGGRLYHTVVYDFRVNGVL